MADRLQEIVKRNPSDISGRENLANAQIRLGSVQQGTSQSQHGAYIATLGLHALEELGRNQQPSTFLDDLLSTSLLTVEPASLRDPQLAVHYAERAAAASPNKPDYWCHLAQAYRAAGAPAATRQKAATHGLSLLVPPRPGESSSITRRELETEAK